MATVQQTDQSCEEKSSDNGSLTDNEQLMSYKTRWLAMTNVVLTVVFRGFNQACYGSVNNVLSKHFNVAPWQIDWLVMTQAVVFTLGTIPTAFLTVHLRLKTINLLMTGSLVLGMLMTAVAFIIPNCFPLAIAGQMVSGLSNIFSMSIVPETAATWFPTNEVSTVVGFMSVSRGIGEAVGAMTTPLLVNMNQSFEEVGERMAGLLAGAASILLISMTLTFLVVPDRPPLPPSVAQAKRLRQPVAKITVKEFFLFLKDLFSEWPFVVVWITFAVVSPVLRNFTILLSSMLHTEFKDVQDLNEQSGFIIMAAWILSLVGGIGVGPVLTKTKCFKWCAVASVGLQSLATLLALIGARISSIALVFGGVVMVGFSIGMACTCLYELVVEVTYPRSPLRVAMLNLIGLGVMRLLYPLLGRVLLSTANTASSLALPFAMTTIITILLLATKLPYKRTDAEISEHTSLLEELKE